MEQIVLTTTIVAACALYAAWVLMPAAARRWVVRGMLAAPLPKGLASALSPYATAPTGCACDGCDKSALAKPAKRGVQASVASAASTTRAAITIAPITFHPRSKR